MAIDFDSLRDAIENEALAAYFGGGFGGALIEASHVKYASESELLRIAKANGIDVSKYDDGNSD